MNKTNIEYLDYTWNPIAMRCTPCSPGCERCWHIRMAKRLAGNSNLKLWKSNAYAGGGPVLDREELQKPLSLKNPCRIGVQFMGDLFHEAIRWRDYGTFWEMPTAVYDAMMKVPQHTFLVLTKRPGNMHEFYREWIRETDKTGHIWQGVSVCNQDELWKIDELLKIPAAVRWVSIEPMLEPMDLGHINLNWVVLGGESGPGARPMHPDWVRSIRDQCRAAGVPFLFKQWGEWAPAKLYDTRGLPTHKIIMGGNGHVRSHGSESLYEDDVIMARWPKRVADHFFDYNATMPGRIY